MEAGAVDRWRWKHDENGAYAVTKAYNLRRREQDTTPQEKLTKLIYRRLWKTWAVVKSVPIT